jgi:hypothetical protein
MCMTSWVKSEAWECGLGHTFKEKVEWKENLIKQR